MDGQTLAAVMGHSLTQAAYDGYADTFNAALVAAHCTNVNRVAMFCAQLGEESGGLRWMQELASGSEYEGRKDLGNIQRGDGVRFKGRGPIQLTGRANYGAFSRWAHAQGYVPSDDYFVQNPLLVAQPRWGFLAASWYWTVARPRLNSQADAGDIVGATRSVNGGTNGLADRTARWKRALTFGTRLLPDDGGDDLTPDQAQKLEDVHNVLTALLKPWPGGVSDKEPAKLEDPNVAGYNVAQYLLRNNVEIHQIGNRLAALEARLGAKP